MYKLPKKLAKTKYRFFVLILLSIFLSFSLGIFSSSVSAQDTTHSLRPYPAEPFSNKEADTALFCGNNLILSYPITKARGNATSCETLSNGNERCRFTTGQVSKTIRIDLSEANLPILGNTENVVNSDKNEDDSGFDDAGKMNEYLSWYLNGTINRAEYGLLDGKDKEDIKKIIDYSGPINKLLPWNQQVTYRINTIKQANETLHDQKIACVMGVDIPLIGSLTKPIIYGHVVPCDNEGIIETLINIFSLKTIDLQEEILLSEWKGKISNAPTLKTTWNNRIPPIRENFDTFLEYWKAYKEWRGDSCLSFTLLGKKLLFCGDNPLRPNLWSNLFPYIPYSSTEDEKGYVETKNISVSSEDVTLKSASFSDQRPAELFFAHTEEVVDLASILQTTFVPKDQENNLSLSGVATSEYCDLVEIRTNEGDDLYAGEIQGTLNYEAEFTCDFGPNKNACENAGGKCVTVPDCSFVNKETINGGKGCDDDYDRCCSSDQPSSEEECTKQINISMSVVTESPGVDKIWGRLVAGSSAVFKRMFPKIGPNTDLGCLLDIPAATKVNYSGIGLSEGETVTAGNPAGERSGESAELYFPHVGGIYEYFLKGTQTLLRPKGYGETIAFGSPGDPNCIQNTSTIDICSGDCNPNPTNVDMAGVKEKFMDLANRWLPTGTARTDKYDQVVSASLSRGVDPIFTLAIWLHESGASNYLGVCDKFGGGNPSTLYCQKILDFGVDLTEATTIINTSGETIKDNFSNQLGRFVNLPDYYLSACNVDTTKCAWEIFGAEYESGSCTPNDTSNKYVAGILEIYRWLSPTQQFPCYPTKLPN